MKSLLPLLLLGLVACQADSARVHVRDASVPSPVGLMSDDDDDDDENEVVIPADQIPAHVRAAALAAVPGLDIDEAELETSKDGHQEYCVHGHVDGRFVEVEVDADGTVLEIEDDDDDEDD